MERATSLRVNVALDGQPRGVDYDHDPRIQHPANPRFDFDDRVGRLVKHGMLRSTSQTSAPLRFLETTRV